MQHMRTFTECIKKAFKECIHSNSAIAIYKQVWTQGEPEGSQTWLTVWTSFITLIFGVPVY